MNQVTVTGRMVRDPEMKVSKKSGKQFCSMRFAIQGEYRGRGTQRETWFVDVLAFDSRAQAMYRNVRKGMRMLLSAAINVYDYIDVYGQKQERMCLIVKSYEMIDSREFKEPIRDLSDSTGELLIPKEITDSLIRSVDAKDEDVPYEYAERSADDLF